MSGDFPHAEIDRVSEVVNNSALAPSVAEDIKTLLRFCWATKAEKDRTVALAKVEASGKFMSFPETLAMEQKMAKYTPALHVLGQGALANIIDDLMVSHKNLHAKSREMATALIMYGNPDSYFAMTFTADRPAGCFAEDFSKVPDSFYDRAMPGRAAREVLYGNAEQAPIEEHLRLVAAE